MKRGISLIVALVILFTFAIPFQGFAAGMDEELENAIKIAKTKFQIPAEYKFSSSISTSGDKKIYYLNWRKDDDVDYANISVAVDGSGMIVSYNKYSRSDYTQSKRLPSLSKQEARVKAEAYIEEIAPGLMKNIKYEETSQTSTMSSSYYYSYYRVENGVPFYNDRVQVGVSSETGELQDYNRRWTDELVFPSVKEVISVEEAQKAYGKNLGLKLIYKTSTIDDEIKAYLVYIPIYNNSDYGINAITGERQRISNYYLYGGFGADTNEAAQKSMSPDRGAYEVELSPEELEAVQEAGKLKSLEEVEKIARSSKFLNISDEHKRQSYYLGTNWPAKDEYVWSLQFGKPTESGKHEDYHSVTINAKTGVIVSFYRGGSYKEDAEAKDDFSTVKKNVDAFLTEYYPEYYKQIEYDKVSDESYSGNKAESYYLNYYRLVNGVAYPDNGININYDNVNGMIIGFTLNWYNISFPTASKVIGVESACEKLYEKVGLGLEYKYKYDDVVGTDYSAENDAKKELVLVYTLKPNKPYVIDANSGVLLTYNGTEYKEAVKVDYTDIKGHYAEDKIKTLAEYGIYLEGTEFKPNATITQKEFLSLLSKTLHYYNPIITPRSTDKEIDELYAYLQREGVIKAGERNPDGVVTREEALKYAIRALKFDKVADIKGIFNCSFEDKAKIDENLIGYVTIAAGLGIVNGNGGKFRPKDNLSRAESVVLIYNYLRI